MDIKQTCPKCGGTFTQAYEEDGYIVCLDCGYWTGEYASWHEAVEIWNSQPLLDRAVKAEREMESAYRDASRLTTRLLEQESKTRAVMREMDEAREGYQTLLGAVSTPSEACRVAHIQACHACDNAACGDNTTPSVVALREERNEARTRLERVIAAVQCAHGCVAHEGFPNWRLTEIIDIAEGRL